MLKKKSVFCCLATAGLLLAFCNDGGDKGTNPPDSTTTESYGALVVTLNGNDTVASVSGGYYDGTTPQPTVWDVVMTDGDMKLVVPRKFTCDSSCGSNSTCVEGDTCQSYPNQIDAGAITLSGLSSLEGTTTQTMKAVGVRKVYQNIDEYTYPPFAEGATISATSTGSGLQPAFSMTLKGIKPIKILNQGINLIKGQPINLQWDPPAAGGDTKIHVLIDITYHGGTKAKIEGETQDDGELVIGAPILDKLQTYGLSGFPKIEVIRRTEAVDENTKTKFSLESTITYELLIDGFHSCNDFADCPAGMGFTSCSVDRKCQ